MTRSSSDTYTGWVMLTPALVFIGIFSLYPSFESLWLSFHRLFLGLPFLGNPFVGFDNYVQLFHDPVARQAYIVTFG
ncbi:MAG: sugar ABC transporter permease, partial [Nitrospirae bacterium]|nr:sugar ABC transporter permease [Nitrospirota bacterium]